MSSAGLAPRPAHVPESAVFEFDIFDERLLDDPHKAALEMLRDAPPFFWTPHNGGQWIATRYDECFEVLRTPELYSSGMMPESQREQMMSAMPEGMPRVPLPTPIHCDPPEHTKYRQPLQKTFAPKTINALKNEIVQLSHELIDAVIDEGACDFIAAVGEQLPVQVFLKMMGLPSHRLLEFRELVREVFKPSADHMQVVMNMRRIVDVMSDDLLDRRDNPKDDLMSQLWTLEIDGKPITQDEVEDYALLLFLAGLDTVVNAIGFGVRHMAVDQQFQSRLRKNPELISEATEELLRRFTMTVPVRRVLKPVKLAEHQLQPDDQVITYLPLADMDGREFPNPQDFDIDRDNKRHMAFGMGPHRCLGSHLARLELQTLYAVVLERLPPFRLDADKPVRFHAGQMLAVASLPIRWD